MTLGLVLSGGGMRGAAHIGAIKALEEHNLNPTHISGTSAGAIVGALYAYGYTWEEILVFFKDIKVFDITKYALNKPGFIDTDKFYSAFKYYLKEDNFNALKKFLIITATDIINGKLDTFYTGELIKPILASAAFPGVFAPIKFNDSYYIDGGSLNNFPVDLLKGRCDRIIGVNVNGFDTISIKDLKYSHNVVERAFLLKTFKEDQEKFKDCDLVIAPKALNKYPTFDRKYINQIFEIGYDSTIKALNDNSCFL
jgi:NTE family protein